MDSERKRRVQDDSREAALARILDLAVSDRRIGADAQDGNGNPYELKTTTTTSLGTGRDIGFPYLEGMRGRYLIAARGEQTRYGFAFQSIFFLHPDDLSDWITAIENRLAADDLIIKAAEDALARSGGSPADVTRLRYLGSRGLTLNNPKIPWAYIQQHGALLGDHPELDLRELVAKRPLPMRRGGEVEVNPTPEQPPPIAEQ